MIKYVNEAINRKLNSISFTDIIVGTVQSLDPLQIRINSKIVIGQSFIEPMSLGINDNSPSSALPLIVGEKIQMIRYNNGQRFYVLGKSSGKATSDYKELENLPKLDTTSSTSLSTSSSEEIIDVIKLHKVAKTGKYSDLVGAPAPITDYMTLTTDQTVTGKKTYNVLPESSVVPTSGNQFVNKNYVDSNFLQYEVIEEF